VTPRAEHILGLVDDLVANFLYYDRQNDEDFPAGEIEDAIAAGEITVTEMADKFREGLEKNT